MPDAVFIDDSGSMLMLSAAAWRRAVEALPEGPWYRFDHNPPTIAESTADLRCTGGTEIGPVIQWAFDHPDETFLVITDGEFNCPGVPRNLEVEILKYEKPTD